MNAWTSILAALAVTDCTIGQICHRICGTTDWSVIVNWLSVTIPFNFSLYLLFVFCVCLGWQYSTAAVCLCNFNWQCPQWDWGPLGQCPRCTKHGKQPDAYWTGVIRVDSGKYDDVTADCSGRRLCTPSSLRLELMLLCCLAAYWLFMFSNYHAYAGIIFRRRIKEVWGLILKAIVHV